MVGIKFDVEVGILVVGVIILDVEVIILVVIVIIFDVVVLFCCFIFK